MFRLKLIFLVVALYSCEVIAKSPAPEELNWCLDDYPGRHSFEGDKIHGPSVDFMFALADDAGFKLIHSDNTPFERCLRNMRVGQADLMVGLYNKGDRGSYMELLPIYTHLTEKLFYLQVISHY